MKEYEISKHPLTGDIMWKLPYTPVSISLVSKFINENYYDHYTLSFFDSLTQQTMEIDNYVADIIDDITKIIAIISSAEHTFINFIGVNSWSDSYVIGVDFTRGNYKTGKTYHFNTITKILEDID